MAKIPDDEVEIFEVVPQSVLIECLRLENRAEFLRASIKASVKKGSPVEPGDLTAEIIVSNRRNADWKEKLAAIIGEDKVKKIYDETPPTPVESLKISIKKNAVLKRDDIQ